MHFPGLSNRGSTLRPSPTFEVDRLVKEVEKAGKQVINFGIGTPPELFSLMPVALQQSLRTAWEQLLPQLGRYQPATGMPALREAISQRFGNFQPEEILLTGGGGKGGLHLTLFVATDPGDKVLIPLPCWPTYYDLVQDMGCSVVPVSTYETGFILDPERVEEACKKHRPKVILYNSPNNPTGKNIDFKTMLRIDEIAMQYGAVVISDEAYRGQELRPSFDYTRYADRENFTKIRVVTFSKLISLAGERLGFIEAPQHLVTKMANYQSNHSGNPPVAGMHYALTVLLHEQWNDFYTTAVTALKEKQEAAWKILRAHGVDFVEPDGAFYIYLHLPEVTDANQFARELLIEQQVGLIPGVVFDPVDGGSKQPAKHQYFRMAIGAASLDTIEEGAKRIKDHRES